jgi:hypothetical protein
VEYIAILLALSVKDRPRHPRTPILLAAGCQSAKAGSAPSVRIFPVTWASRPCEVRRSKGNTAAQSLILMSYIARTGGTPVSQESSQAPRGPHRQHAVRSAGYTLGRESQPAIHRRSQAALWLRAVTASTPTLPRALKRTLRATPPRRGVICRRRKAGNLSGERAVPQLGNCGYVLDAVKSDRPPHAVGCAQDVEDDRHDITLGPQCGPYILNSLFTIHD